MKNKLFPLLAASVISCMPFSRIFAQNTASGARAAPVPYTFRVHPRATMNGVLYQTNVNEIGIKMREDRDTTVTFTVLSSKVGTFGFTLRKLGIPKDGVTIEEPENGIVGGSFLVHLKFQSKNLWIDDRREYVCAIRIGIYNGSDSSSILLPMSIVKE
jgi:hypothetical protein